VAKDKRPFLKTELVYGMLTLRFGICGTIAADIIIPCTDTDDEEKLNIALWPKQARELAKNLIKLAKMQEKSWKPRLVECSTPAAGEKGRG
jgi:hypothetical protein